MTKEKMEEQTKMKTVQAWYSSCRVADDDDDDDDE
jgi:hypothetical protein